MKRFLCCMLACALLAVIIPSYATVFAKEEPTTVIVDNFYLGYTGQWGHMNNLQQHDIHGYYLDTASSTTADNTSFDYTFNDCTQIFWYANYNPMYARVDIYIDGQFHRTVDCGSRGYATTPALVWKSPVLERGTHTLKVIRRDDESNKGKYFEVDRLEATCYSSCDVSILNNTGVSYFNFVSGFELAESVTDAVGGTVHTASTAGAWLTLSFWGDFIDLYGTMEGGTAEVYIGDEKKATITPGSGRLCSITGLEDDMYTLKLVLIDGSISIDYATTTHPYNAATEIFRLGKEALAQMENGTKGYIPPEQWEPVDKAATYPINGVTLDSGLYYDAFMKNVNMIKRSIGMKDYVTYSSVWIENFPSANEGRVLSAAANSLRFISDDVLDQAVKQLLQKAKDRQKENGYCLPEPEEWYDGLFLTADNPYVSVDECKNYGRVMYTQGLLAAGLAGYEEGYELMRGLYDWLNNCDYKQYLLPGSLGIQGILGATLCYGSPVGEAQDLITNMQYYEMEWYLEYLANAMPEAMYMYPLDRPHAYMATAARAFLDMYGATGATMYLEAALGAWTIFKEYYVTPGGAVCMCEGQVFKPGNQMLSHSNRSVFETCNNVLWADLNHTLLQYFPENERFAYYLEQSIINIVFASQNTNGDIRYMNHMTDKKESATLINTCCEVQAARQLSQLPQFVYSLNDEGVYVNLFADSTLNFNNKNASGTLKMSTDFPYNNDVSITMDMTKSGQMTLWLRIPSWATHTVDISLNGTVIASGTPGSYAPISREFNDGDIISFTLPVQMELIKYNGNSQIDGQVRYGIMYGPIFMALIGPADSTCVQPGGEKIAKLDLTPEQFIQSLTVKNANLLTFNVDGYSKFTLKPYYAVNDYERFDCFPVLLDGPALVQGIPGQTPEPTQTAPQQTQEHNLTTQPAVNPSPSANINDVVKTVCIVIIILTVIITSVTIFIIKKK